MECSCKLYDAGGDEFSKILSAKWVTSKSVHKCTECGKQLKSGTEYYREKTVFDGHFYTFKTCKDCMSKGKTCAEIGYGV